MDTGQERYEFPALRRRLTLLQQELYQTSQALDINRRVPDSTGDLYRYQLASDALSKEIDELTWVLQYLDSTLRYAQKWPPLIWLLFTLLVGTGAAMTTALVLNFR